MFVFYQNNCFKFSIEEKDSFSLFMCRTDFTKVDLLLKTLSKIFPFFLKKN